MNNRMKSQVTAKAKTAQSNHWFLKASLTFLVLLSMIIGASIQTIAATSSSAATASAPVRGAPDSFADLVDQLQPAVVNISTVIKVKNKKGFRVPRGGDWFDNELLDRFRDRYNAEPQEQRSLGSGFFISADGYVVTNNHVVKDASEITIRTVDGKEYAATVKGRDESVDLALLKVDSDEKFPFVKWGDSDAARVGEWVLAIGNPYGFGGTVTAGIISGKSRRLSGGQQGSYENYLQTDAPINRGNSGGPLFNMQGEVVGVNTVIISTTGGNIGIGFSIPAMDAKRIVGQLKEYGKVKRGWLGVSIRGVDKPLAEAMDLPEPNGAIISDVVENAPSEKAGLKVGDIIIGWDGRKVTEKDNLPRLVAQTPVGKKVKVDILRRDGDKFERKTLDVVTGLLKDDDKEVDVRIDEREKRFEERQTSVEGMLLVELNGEMRRRFRLGDETDGVLIAKVDRRSEAGKAGLRTGMVILKVQYKNVEEPSDVRNRIEELRDAGKKSIVLYVQTRDGGKVHLPLKLADDDE